MEEIAEVQEGVRGSKTLWFGMFGSPIIWTIHFILGYLLGEASCEAGLVSNQQTLRVLLIAITLLAIGGIIWNAWWSWRSWRYYASINPEEEHPLQAFDRDEFLALAGLILSGIFFLLLLLNLYPFITLRLCA